LALTFFLQDISFFDKMLGSEAMSFLGFSILPERTKAYQLFGDPGSWWF
jgi:hypothetical protein